MSAFGVLLRRLFGRSMGRVPEITRYGTTPQRDEHFRFPKGLLEHIEPPPPTRDFGRMPIALSTAVSTTALRPNAVMLVGSLDRVRAGENKYAVFHGTRCEE